MVSVTHLILRFAILQNNFQQTNKNKINPMNDNHIKFEVSLHFGGILPTVCQSKLRKKSRILLPSAFLTKFLKTKKMGESAIKAHFFPIFLVVLEFFRNSSRILLPTVSLTNFRPQNVKNTKEKCYQGPILNFLWYFSTFPVRFLLKKAADFNY